MGPRADAYFQARTFLLLARGPGASVPIAALFHHCTARSALIRLVSCLLAAVWAALLTAATP